MEEAEGRGACPFEQLDDGVLEMLVRKYLRLDGPRSLHPWDACCPKIGPLLLLSKPLSLSLQTSPFFHFMRVQGVSYLLSTAATPSQLKALMSQHGSVLPHVPRFTLSTLVPSRKSETTLVKLLSKCTGLRGFTFHHRWSSRVRRLMAARQFPLPSTVHEIAHVTGDSGGAPSYLGCGGGQGRIHVAFDGPSEACTKALLRLFKVEPGQFHHALGRIDASVRSRITTLLCGGRSGPPGLFLLPLDQHAMSCSGLERLGWVSVGHDATCRLGFCPGLRELHLHGRLSTGEELQGFLEALAEECPLLESLSLDATSFTGGTRVRCLARLRLLRHLCLAMPQLHWPDFVAFLGESSLESLKLEEATLFGMPALAAADGDEVTEGEGEDARAAVPLMPRLTRLVLQGRDSAFNATFLRNLSFAPNLSHLQIGLTPATVLLHPRTALQISSMLRLEYLHLDILTHWDANFWDAFAARLALLPRLTAIHSLFDAAPPRCLAAMRHLQGLRALGLRPELCANRSQAMEAACQLVRQGGLVELDVGRVALTPFARLCKELRRSQLHTLHATLVERPRGGAQAAWASALPGLLPRLRQLRLRVPSPREDISPGWMTQVEAADAEDEVCLLWAKALCSQLRTLPCVHLSTFHD